MIPTIKEIPSNNKDIETLKTKLEKGLADLENGRMMPVDKAFDEIRKEVTKKING